VLAIFHLFALPLCHDCSIDQVLKCGEGMIHQMILQRIDQPSQETILPLGIRVDIFWGITRQLQKLVPVLTNRQGTLLQGYKFLLPYYHQSFRHMVVTEVVPEVLSGDGFRVGMGGKVRLPPRLLLPLADGDHIEPSHDRCTGQCATHVPRYATNLQHP